MAARIIDRGRGPEIQGTRITIYDVVDYWKEGWNYAQIAGLFRLLPDEVQAAIDYIEANRDQVMADYQRIIDRHKNYKYPPEVQAKIDQNREKLQRRLAELRAEKVTEGKDAGHPVGSQH